MKKTKKCRHHCSRFSRNKSGNMIWCGEPCVRTESEHFLDCHDEGAELFCRCAKHEAEVQKKRDKRLLEKKIGKFISTSPSGYPMICSSCSELPAYCYCQAEVPLESPPSPLTLPNLGDKYAKSNVSPKTTEEMDEAVADFFNNAALKEESIDEDDERFDNQYLKEDNAVAREPRGVSLWNLRAPGAIEKKLEVNFKVQKNRAPLVMRQYTDSFVLPVGETIKRTDFYFEDRDLGIVKIARDLQMDGSRVQHWSPQWRRPIGMLTEEQVEESFEKVKETDKIVSVKHSSPEISSTQKLESFEIMSHRIEPTCGEYMGQAEEIYIITIMCKNRVRDIEVSKESYNKIRDAISGLPLFDRRDKRVYIGMHLEVK